MMTMRRRAALISADDNLRSVVADALRDDQIPVSVELEVGRPVPDLTPDDLERLRAAEARVLILDLSGEPQRAIRAVDTIAAGNPGAALVGVGPDLDSSTLLEAMRAGIMEYLPRPLHTAAIHDALQRVMRKQGWIGSEGGQRNGQVLSFFSPKGGAGCTSVATNVGIELHRLTGRRTLLVDLDLELGEIASLLGIQPRFHFVDLVQNFHRMDEDLLASYIESHDSGVQVLSAPFEPEIGQQVTGEQIARILGFLRSHYDYVLVDAAKSLAPPALAALQSSDAIFLVTNMDVPTLRNMKRCLPTLDRVTAGEAERLRLVVNRYNPRSLVDVKDLEETLGLEVFATLSNDYQTVIEAISTGRPLVEHSSAAYAGELKQLARTIVEGPEARQPRPSLVRRILSPFRPGNRAGDEGAGGDDAPASGNGAGRPVTAAPVEAPSHG